MPERETKDKLKSIAAIILGFRNYGSKDNHKPSNRLAEFGPFTRIFWDPTDLSIGLLINYKHNLTNRDKKLKEDLENE